MTCYWHLGIHMRTSAMDTDGAAPFGGCKLDLIDGESCVIKAEYLSESRE